MTTFPPELTAQFEPVRVLGEGGFGTVWRARQVGLEREVALKLLATRHLADDREVRRFLDEGRVTARLSHPAIVKVFDVGMCAGQPWIAYELLEGRTLAQAIASAPLPPSEAARACAQVARGLAAAHAAGVLHRDIKPENLVQTDARTVKIMDFGIAQWSSPDRVKTATGVLLGSPAYVAPEVVEGAPASPASDVYALGVTLFQLVTGRVPYTAASYVQVLEQHLRAPVPRAGAAAGLDEVIAAAMAKDPRARPESEELARWLDGVAGGDTVAAPRPRSGGTPAPSRPQSRPVAALPVGGENEVPRAASRARAVMAGALAVAVAAGAWAVAARRTETAPSPSPAASASGRAAAIVTAAPAAPAAVPPPRVLSVDAWTGARSVRLVVELDRVAPLDGEVERAGLTVRQSFHSPRTHRHALTQRLPAADEEYRVRFFHGGTSLLTIDFRTTLDSKVASLRSLLTSQDFGLLQAVDDIVRLRRWLDDALIAQAIRAQPISLLPDERLASLALEAGSETIARALADRPDPVRRPDIALLTASALAADERLALRMLERARPELRKAVPEFRLHFACTNAEAHPRWTPREIADAAVEIGSPAAPDLARLMLRRDRDAARALFEQWNTPGESQPHRLLALHGLIASGEPRDRARVHAAVTAADPVEAALAMALAAQSPTPEARVALMGALPAQGAPGPDLTWALARAGCTSAVPRLVQAAARGEPRSRIAALCALPLLARSPAPPEVLRAMKDGDPAIVRAAAWALGRMRDPAALEPLAQLDASAGDTDGVGAWALLEVAPDRTAAVQAALRARLAHIDVRDTLRIAVAYLALARCDRARALDLADAMRRPRIDKLSEAADLASGRAPLRQLVFPFVMFDRVDLDVTPGVAFDARAHAFMALHAGDGTLKGIGDLRAWHPDLTIECVLHLPHERGVGARPRTYLRSGAEPLLAGPFELNAPTRLASIAVETVAGAYQLEITPTSR